MDRSADAARRARLERRVRHAARELSLQTQSYVAALARSAGLHSADVQASGIIQAAAEAGDELTPGALGRALALSPAAVTALLDRMEHAGHVSRVRSSIDARRVSVAPTEAADVTTHALFDPLVEAYSAALAGYSAAELDLVAEVLEALRSATRAAGENR